MINPTENIAKVRTRIKWLGYIYDHSYPWSVAFIIIRDGRKI